MTAAAIIPAAVAAYMMCTHWVALPYWDAWNTPAAQIASWCRGTLTLGELFSQHNEHRPFFPRLVNVPLGATFGWDVRREMAMGFLLLCGCSAVLYALLRQTMRSTGVALAAWAVANLLLFTPRQYENFLASAEGGSFLPAVALLCAMWVNLSKASFAAKTMLNAALAFVSTYTFGNGMLLWPLAFPLAIASARATSAPEESPRHRRMWRAIYIAAAAGSVALYFISYVHPPLSPPPASIVFRAPEMLVFFATWAGATFLPALAAHVGAAALLLFAGLSGCALWLAVRTKQWRPHYPWVLLGVYVLISGAVTTRARLEFGVQLAAQSRYVAFTPFLYIALLGLGLSVYRQLASPAARRSMLAGGAVCVAAIIILSGAAFAKQRRALKPFKQHREHLQRVVQWSIAIPTNPEIALFSPYPETLDTIRTLADAGVLRPPLVPASLAQQVQIAPREAAQTTGVLDRVTRLANGINFRGWAAIPGEDRAADLVVIGHEDAAGGWTPWAVTELGVKRRTLAERLAMPQLSRAGFSLDVITDKVPSEPVTFRAWAVDLGNLRAFPMAGAVPLDPR
jgi:hypothetical protein